MWPKVIAQLVELLPHATRLIPMADKFLSSSKSSEAKIATMSEQVQGGLEQVSLAHTRLDQQLQAQASQIGEIAQHTERARMAAELAQNRVEEMERTLKSLGIWLKINVAVAILLLLCALLLVVHPGR